MSQLVLPSGFELITFIGWDEMPTLLRGNRGAGAAAPALDFCAHVSPAIRAIDCGAMEEDAERWDGLS